MNESIRVSGKTVNDAVMNAAIALSTTSDNIEYTVIEKESKGFLGIGSRDAVIEAKVKEQASEEEAESSEETAVEKSADVFAEVSGQKSEEQADKADSSASEHEPKAAAAVFEAASEKTGSAASLSEEDEDSYEKRREHRNSDIKVLEDPSEAIERAETFLKDVFSSMGMSVEISSNYDGECLNVSMEGDEMGLLIGKRGQTLDALQYIINLVVNKKSEAYIRIKLDTENYRERRRATLENLARNIAYKVKRTRKSVVLEPMNPYERRIIHSALQNDRFVETHSEGDEPYRKVVVTLKKEYRGKRTGGGRGGYNRYNGRRQDRRNAGRGAERNADRDNLRNEETAAENAAQQAAENAAEMAANTEASAANAAASAVNTASSAANTAASSVNTAAQAKPAAAEPAVSVTSDGNNAE